MNKLEELRKMVAELFEKAEDKTTIQNSARITQKIDEVAEEQAAKQNEYNDLLKDYKEVIVHTSVKQDNKSLNIDKSGAPDVAQVFDANDAFQKAISENIIK